MHVDTTCVFNQRPFKGLCIGEFDDAGGDGEKLCQLRGAEASRSRYDLEAFRVWAHGDGLDEAVLPNAFCEFMQLGFFKRPARVGGGLVDGVESEELECAAVLHDCPPWAGLKGRGVWSEHDALCPLRCGTGLGAWGLLPLEGFGESLQTQVVVQIGRA